MPNLNYPCNSAENANAQIDEITREISRAFSLTMNEARVYVVLLKSRSLTASQISAISGVHRSRVYDNLKSLRGRKLIQEFNDEPKRYCAIPIQESLNHILAELENEYFSKVGQVKALCSRLIRVFDESSPDLESTYIIDHDRILDELHRLLKTVNTRVWVCKRTAGGLLDWYLLRDDLIQLLARTVDIRFLGTEQVKIGLPARLNPEVRFSFAILDSIAITFLLKPNNDEQTKAVVSQHEDYVKFLADYFIDQWNNAEE